MALRHTVFLGACIGCSGSESEDKAQSFSCAGDSISVETLAEFEALAKCTEIEGFLAFSWDFQTNYDPEEGFPDGSSSITRISAYSEDDEGKHGLLLDQWPLPDLTFFSNLEAIPGWRGELAITGFDTAIENLTGLENLTTAGTVRIEALPKVTSLEPLFGLTDVKVLILGLENVCYSDQMDLVESVGAEEVWALPEEDLPC